MAGSAKGIPRFGRGTFLLWLLVGGIGFNVVDFVAFRRLDVTVQLGFRFGALTSLADAPAWRIAAEIAFDIALLVVAIGRLHDSAQSGWWLLVLTCVSVAAALSGIGLLGLVVLAGWIALLFWPGTIGPNRFGPDPRGWLSREHFERQQRELAAQRRS